MSAKTGPHFRVGEGNNMDEQVQVNTGDAAAMKIFVAVPCFDKKVFVPCVQGLMNATQVFLWNKIQFEVKFEVGLPYVSMARNNLVRAFMESNFTDLVFIDTDLGFPPAAFRDLIYSPEDVVAGVYPKKQNTEMYPVLLKTDEQGHPVVENGLLLASGLPTGFMKIRRQVFEKLGAAHPELAYVDALSGKTTYNFFGTFVRDGRWYGDDYGFCALWNDLGGKCYALPDITFVHCGGRNFEGNFHQHLLNMSAAAGAVAK